MTVKFITIYRNAINGETCTKKYAEKNPETTTKETRINLKPTLVNFLKFAKKNPDLTDKQLIDKFL